MSRKEKTWLHWMNKVEIHRFCIYLEAAELDQEDLAKLAEAVAKKQKEAKQ